MKKYLSIFLIVVLSFSLMACSKDNDKLRLDIQVQEEIVDGKLNVVVNTNLPDSTQASITLVNDDINYVGMAGVVVKDGKTELSEMFSNKGRALEKGNYTLSFVAPLSKIQPESVQKIIGESYSNFESEYIFESEYGTIIQLDKKIEIK